MVRSGSARSCAVTDFWLQQPADVLGEGSTQDSQDNSKDDPFWDALNAKVKNLHGVISGHGALSLFDGHPVTYSPGILRRPWQRVVQARAVQERHLLLRQAFWVRLPTYTLNQMH